MPRRSLLVEAFVKKFIDENVIDTDEIYPEFFESPALSLEFLEPYVNAKGYDATVLCPNKNIPWQYFDEHMDEIDDEFWEYLATNPDFPEEFYWRHLDKVSPSWNEILWEHPNFSSEFVAQIVERLPLVEEDALAHEWAKPERTLPEIQAKLHEMYQTGEPQRGITKGMARNPNLTVEFVKQCQEKSYDEFIRDVFMYNDYLPWSFFEENLAFAQEKELMEYLARKPQISWDFLLQHPELIYVPAEMYRSRARDIDDSSDDEDKESRYFQLVDLLHNNTMTDEFATKYLPDVIRLDILNELTRNSGPSLAFFRRNADLIFDNEGTEGLCENPSLPLEFFEKDPMIITFKALLRNEFTYQFDIENGLQEEETIYNAQTAINEQGSPNNLPNLMLGVMREQHGKMVDRAYHR